MKISRRSADTACSGHASNGSRKERKKTSNPEYRAFDVIALKWWQQQQDSWKSNHASRIKHWVTQDTKAILPASSGSLVGDWPLRYVCQIVLHETPTICWISYALNIGLESRLIAWPVLETAFQLHYSTSAEKADNQKAGFPFGWPECIYFFLIHQILQVGYWTTQEKGSFIQGEALIQRTLILPAISFRLSSKGGCIRRRFESVNDFNHPIVL